MKSKIFFSVLISLKGNILSAHPSLFFTKEEVNHIRECFSSKENSNLRDSGRLSLSALMYFDEGHWSLWVNDKIINPENSHEIKDFHLEKVTPREVEFSWTPPDSSTPIKFTLHPYQTYMARK